MGIVRVVNPVVFRNDCVVLESGKLLRRIWKDKTFTNFFRRNIDGFGEVKD